MDYWVDRAAFAMVFASLDQANTPQSAALRSQYEELRDRIAAESVLAWPPSGAKLAASVSVQRVRSAPIVRLTSDMVEFEGNSWSTGKELGPLTTAVGQAHADRKAREAAARAARPTLQMPDRFVFGPSERLILQVDGEVPFSRMKRVMQAAAGDTRTRFDLAVLHPIEGQRFISLPPPPEADGPPIEEEPEWVHIRLTSDGIEIRTEGEAQAWPCPSGACASAEQALVRVLDACRQGPPTASGEPTPRAWLVRVSTAAPPPP